MLKSMLSAFALFATPALADVIRPPAEFDHPYKGKIVVETLSWQGALKRCRDLSGKQWYACSWKKDGVAYMVIFDRSDTPGEVLRAEDIEWTRRHEIAHLNGWPGDHRGGCMPRKPEVYDGHIRDVCVQSGAGRNSALRVWPPANPASSGSTGSYVERQDGLQSGVERLVKSRGEPLGR